jgi:hypothetical protein
METNGRRQEEPVRAERTELRSTAASADALVKEAGRSLPTELERRQTAGQPRSPRKPENAESPP